MTRAHAAALQSVQALQRALESLKAQEGVAESLKMTLAELEDKVAAGEAKARELFEENQRLENHCHDLETRKRAPLYQRKQEQVG